VVLSVVKIFLLIFLLAIIPVGCSQTDRNIPVKGKVLVAGQPAPGAVLIFLREGGGAEAVSGSAVASEDGSYSVKSSMQEGLPPGNYSVGVTWPDTSKKLTPGQIMQGATPEDGPDKLQGKYSNPKSSNLHVEVKSGSAEIPPFNL